MRLTLWSAALLAIALPQLPASAPDLRFHHLHIRDAPPDFWIGYYERLFDPAVTQRVSFAGASALQTGTRLIVVSPTQTEKVFPAALWHFGWGKVSLGETYLAHARAEVAWEPPLPPEDLHVHLRSLAPVQAALWYRDVLGAQVQLAVVPSSSTAPLPPPEDSIPDALVDLGGLRALVYRTAGVLVSSIGQRVDHVAFSCADLGGTLAYLRSKGVAVISGPNEDNGIRTAMIVGPDRIAIELVQLD
jgi:hypothetical protein